MERQPTYLWRQPALTIPEKIEAVGFLADEAGQRLLASLGPADVSGQRLLHTVERIRAKCGVAAVSLVVELVAGRAAAVRKFGPDHPRWYTRTALEQASGAIAADHRAERLSGFGAVLEVCAGMGGDTLALARAGASVVAVESDPLLADMVRRNLSEAGFDETGEEAGRMGGRVQVRTGEAEAASLDGFGVVYADPSRRSENRRSTSLKRLSPPIDFLSDLAGRAPATTIKLAPAASLSALRDAFPGAEIEFVSVDGELKEAVIWAGQAISTSLRATVLGSGAAADNPRAELTGEPGHYLPVQEPGRFIAEPEPALVRSGLFTEFAAATGIEHGVLAEQIAFLASNTAPTTPFARYYRVIDALPFSDRAIGERLRKLGSGSVAVRCRGFPEPGDVIAARLQRYLRGDTPYRLFVYRSGERHHAVIAEFKPAAGE